METAVKERLIGAAVLVTLVVIVVPALLSGPREPALAEPPADAATRSVEITLGRPADPAEALPGEPVRAAPEADPVASGAVSASGATEPASPESAASGSAPAAPPVEEGAVAGPAPPPLPAGSAWAVQVAALSSRDAAERLVADLKRRGYPAFSLEYRADGKLFHRVRVGPEPQRERAGALAERLKSDGFKAAVVSHP